MAELAGEVRFCDSSNEGDLMLTRNPVQSTSHLFTPTAGRSIVSMTGVIKNYGSQMVLNNINLNIQKGEFVYVVGDSGAGKSTLLKMIYGEEQPTRGGVEIFGNDVVKSGFDKNQLMRRKIGVIFQDLRLIEEMSAYDNVALSLRLAGDAAQYSGQSIAEALSTVGLSSMQNKKVSSLSGGERQRVAAARAIVRKPEILIADEPTGSLDKDHTWNLIDLFQKLNLKGTTIIVATHDREIVRRIRKRSYILKGGKLVMEEGICLF